MHIVFLVFSYAFSIWMLIDAVKRGARHWWMIIILVPFGEFIYFFMVKIKDFKGAFQKRKAGKKTASETLQCKTCVYCEAIDKDGVVCFKKGKRMFIPLEDAALCYDYERKRRRLF